LGKKAASLFLARTVAWFGESRRLWIGIPIKVFDEFYFARSTIQTLSFEAGSELARIEAQSFANCSLKVVNWLASLAFVGGSSFESAKIGTLKFECQFSKISEAAQRNPIFRRRPVSGPYTVVEKPDSIKFT
jgi:hypothetical protein